MRNTWKLCKCLFEPIRVGLFLTIQINSRMSITQSESANSINPQSCHRLYRVIIRWYQLISQPSRGLELGLRYKRTQWKGRRRKRSCKGVLWKSWSCQAWVNSIKITHIATPYRQREELRNSLNNSKAKPHSPKTNLTSPIVRRSQRKLRLILRAS